MNRIIYKVTGGKFEKDIDMKTTWYKIAQTAQEIERSEKSKGDIFPSSDIVCPFCKEKDFDLQGLKGHLVNEDCEIYNKINVVPRLMK